MKPTTEELAFILRDFFHCLVGSGMKPHEAIALTQAADRLEKLEAENKQLRYTTAATDETTSRCAESLRKATES